MALALLHSRGQAGLQAYPVTVEVHIAGGLPGLSLVGLPNTSVRESRDRVRAALQTCSLPVPPRRVTVHLGPADIPKDGGRFDLAIALGVIHAEHRREWKLQHCEFIGELSLGGQLRSVSGVLPAVIAARDAGRSIVVPATCADAVAQVADHTALAADHLQDVVSWLDGATQLPRIAEQSPPPPAANQIDMADVHGQPLARRAVLVAAAGGHNLLLFGPPGSGKTMLAERLPTLLPPLNNAQYLTAAAVASLVAQAPPATSAPPFRAPHHTASARALLGGGAQPRPGEVTLAHNGVLFLDELPEFSRDALEGLREPLETGSVTISRALRQVQFPAAFQLIAAMNPCPCGYRGDPQRCTCTPAQLARYAARISGPLLDRIDLHVEVPYQRPADAAAQPGADSATLAARVHDARARQLQRAGMLNARLSAAALQQHVQADADARALLHRCTERWHLSSRAATRILKTARTIADIDAERCVIESHIAEALQLRQFDRHGSATVTQV